MGNSLHGFSRNRLHSFMSPFSNKRTDEYGGSLYASFSFCSKIPTDQRGRICSANRMRLVLDIAVLTRALWPADKPVFARISITDHHVHGEKNSAGEYISWGVESSKVLISELVKLGVDLVDCTSGGLDPDQRCVTFPSSALPKITKADHQYV